MNLDPTAPFIPLFLVAMVIENAVLTRRGRAYDRPDALRSLGLGLAMSLTLTLFRVYEAAEAGCRTGSRLRRVLVGHAFLLFPWEAKLAAAKCNN